MNDIVLYACVDTHKHTHTLKNGERIHVFLSKQSVAVMKKRLRVRCQPFERLMAN